MWPRQAFTPKQMNNAPRISAKVLRAALLPFLLTRILILTVFVLGAALTFDEPVQELGARIQEPVLSLRQPDLKERFDRSVSNADAGWYLRIARDGYERQPFEATQQHNWAFLPVFPLVYRFAMKLTGENAVTGVLLSTLIFLLALMQLYQLVREFGYEPGDAARSIFYLAAFPTSYFFSLPVTESLFLLLSVCCFLAAKRDKWWLAGIYGGIAASTRVAGLYMLPALALLYWEQQRSLNHRALALLLIPAGMVPYILFLHRITGDGFAFLKVQAAWGHRIGFFLLPLWECLKNPTLLSFRWNFYFLNFLAAMLAMICSGVMFKRKQWSLGVYTTLSIIIPLSGMSLQSVARYTMLAFPIFILLAEAGRNRIVDQTIRTVFLFLLALLTGLFVLHFSMAMS